MPSTTPTALRVHAGIAPTITSEWGSTAAKLMLLAAEEIEKMERRTALDMEVIRRLGEHLGKL